MSETITLQASELDCRFDGIELQDNGENAKTAKFRAVARTNNPIDHHEFGSLVHDFDGMKTNKSRVPINWCHWDSIELGYANKIQIEDGNLVMSGVVQSFSDFDKAAEVIFRARNGAPYEASISHDHQGLRLQYVSEGEVTEVNGSSFEGPGVIIREWTLRHVAVCPSGYDGQTEVEIFSANRKKELTLTIEKGNDMKEETELNVEAAEQDTVVESKDEAVEVEAVVEAEAQAEDSEVVAKVEAVAKTVEAETESVEEQASENEVVALAQPYLDAFGVENGAVYYALGFSMETACKEHITSLKAENEKLKQRLSANVNSGLAEPVEIGTQSFEAEKPADFQSLIRLPGENNNN